MMPSRSQARETGTIVVRVGGAALEIRVLLDEDPPSEVRARMQTLPFGDPEDMEITAPLPLVSRRRRGEELVGDLVFAADALRTGASSVATLDAALAAVMRYLPCRAVLAHVLDPTASELVIACARGALGPDALLRRHGSDDAFLRAALTRFEAKRFSSADGRLPYASRFAEIGPVRDVFVVPLVHDDLTLVGALELVDPIDGEGFEDDDGAGLEYLARRAAGLHASFSALTSRPRAR